MAEYSQPSRRHVIYCQVDFTRKKAPREICVYICTSSVHNFRTYLCRKRRHCSPNAFRFATRCCTQCTHQAFVLFYDGKVQPPYVVKFTSFTSLCFSFNSHWNACSPLKCTLPTVCQHHFILFHTPKSPYSRLLACFTIKCLQGLNFLKLAPAYYYCCP